MPRVPLLTWVLPLVTISACGVSDPSSPALVGCLPAFADIEETAQAELQGSADAALLVRVEGQTVCRLFFGAYGPDTRVATASAAKWLTAGAILSLVDQGKLRLDTRASSLFPSAPAATANITITQLLSHTSGLLWFSRCMGRADDTLQGCAETILESDLHFEPGTGFFYSGPPFTVAGAMAERATGKGWEEIFRTTIADPLGMSNTSYGSGPNPALSEGQVVSSLDDYAAFAQMILDGGRYAGRRVLSEEAVGEMRRNRTAGLPVAFSPLEHSRYSLGAWLDEVDASGMGTVLSSPGIGGFVPIVDYGRRMVVVFEAQDERMWPAINAILAGVRAAVDRER
jgi:CubicO group peptidase (beta-lactamase class C family)